jgi:peptidoglycan/LPS O-acetylase OafA/YrhL
MWMRHGTSPFGRLAVGLFLILSGYLITGIMLKSKVAIERG